MYFSRIAIKPDHGALRTIFTADGNAEHKLLWSLFPGRANETRPFLYRRDVSGGDTVFYLVSKIAPDENSAALALETKLYEPTLCRDEILEFKLRANPVVSRRDATGKLHRHDVVMDAKSREAENGGTSLMEIAREVGVVWLSARAEKCGFRLVDGTIRVDGYRRHRWFKRGQKNAVQLSTLDFSGILKVADPERLRSALMEGIGPAKGFGCGLLLVRRQTSSQ